MPRILAFTSGPQDWQTLLAYPVRHWKSGYSARTLAHSWEAADGFPSEVALSFTQSTEPLLTNLTPLLAVPEFKVPLPGGARASQNDIFILARSSSGPVSIVVEGKVNESFGPTLDEWRSEASPGKEERLSFLLRSLGLGTVPAVSVRYQILHRAASAIIAGEQYRAAAAVLLVHSFSQQRAGWSDYRTFTRLFGVEAIVGSVQHLDSASSVPLFGVWVVGNPFFLQS
ncbi:MAG: hypothetical protein COS92_05010 [Desulfobacterales bacterium CG07_land_8_20_14_0_80_52_14]|nr:MAG: hypothetical protein COS92_05010 [Desulfobacterales bacterium CG07_land_8_20_14_0_80_52_14]